MKKIKFQIKGIHCNSCVILIEEHLKNKTGIINAKVNLDSQKAVIVYDEEKINGEEIIKIIKEAGNYQVEKIKDTEEENINEDVIQVSEIKNNFSRSNFSIPISIIVAGLMISGAILYSSADKNKEKNISAKKTAQVQNLPSQPSNNNAQRPLPSDKNAPNIQTFEITKDNHIRGDFNAPITLVEFSDFECPFSGRHYPTLDKISNDYKGKIRWVYKHFPLSFHQNAQKAAEASECASEQGKFWEYHDKLFENQSTGYSLEKFKQWAKDLRLGSGKFNDCLDSGKFAQKVKDDFQEGTQKGVNGTPATFVNGQLISGALPYESFKQIIDSISQ